MRVEAIIVQQNRRPIKVILRNPRQKTFTLGAKEQAETYHLDPDCAVFGSRKDPKQLWLGKEDVNRYYFRANHPKPISFYDKNGKAPKNDNSSLLMHADELGQIFNPFFYNVIARAGKDKRGEITMYLAGIAAIGSAYAAYQFTRVGPLIQEMARAMGIGG